MSAAIALVAGIRASGGPVSLWLYPFLAVMVALVWIVDDVQRRKKRSNDDEES